jgi:hypothetical protein
VVAAVLDNNLTYPRNRRRPRGTEPDRPFIRRLTIDSDARLKPDLVADLGVWGRDHTAALLDVYPNMRFVLHASPPCQGYSRAATKCNRSKQERQSEADLLVAAALQAYHDLGDRALAMTIENPGTGDLVGREVRGCTVDAARLCAYAAPRGHRAVSVPGLDTPRCAASATCRPSLLAGHCLPGRATACGLLLLWRAHTQKVGQASCRAWRAAAACDNHS